MANSVCIAQALSSNVQLKGLMKDLRALAKRPEEALHYRDAVREAKAKVVEVEEKRSEVEG